MEDFDFSQLSPEDKDSLLKELYRKYQNDIATKPTMDADKLGQFSAGDHPDKEEDLELLEPVFQVLEILISQLEEQECKIDRLTKLVEEDFFGGIESVYKSNLRTNGISAIKNKYGHMFEDKMDALKELEPDTDIFEKLYDLLDQARSGGEELDDEGEATRVSDIAKMLGDKIQKIKGAGPAKVETLEVTAVPEEGGADEEFLKKVKAMKEKAKGVKGIF